MKNTGLLVIGLVLVLLVKASMEEIIYPKCCGPEEHLDKTFTCKRSPHQTISKYIIFAEEYSSLNNTKQPINESCLEFQDDAVKLFNISASGEMKNSKEIEYFPKCCPLRYVYNTKDHSCVLDEERNSRDFIRAQVVKIGLHDCKLSVDYNDVFLGNIRKGNLIISGRNFSRGNYCIEASLDGGLVARGCHKDFEVCKGIRCIRKCCPDGQSFIGGSKCKVNYEAGVDLHFSNRIDDSDDPFAIVYGYNCSVYLANESRYLFSLLKDGTYSIFRNDTNSFVNKGPEEISYCIEHAQKKSINSYQFFMCMSKKPVVVKFQVTRWIKIVSIFCLVLTLLVYGVNKEMRNLFGMTLMSYCVCLVLMFASLAYFQFSTIYSNKTCYITSFINYYLIQAQYFWSNVICFDIWLTLGSSKAYLSVQQKTKQMKRFLIYSLYGWGLPLIWVMIIFAVSKIDSVPYEFQPHLGSYKCYLERRPNSYSYYIYVLLTLTILGVVNLFLFGKTIVYCLRVKSEISNMKSVNKEKKQLFAMDKERLLLILKLLVIMGVFYTFEIVSSFVDFSKVTEVTKYIEVIWDSIVCLQGVFVFIIFVCKKKVWKSLTTRCRVKKYRKSSLSSTCTSHLNMNRVGNGDTDKFNESKVNGTI